MSSETEQQQQQQSNEKSHQQQSNDDPITKVSSQDYIEHDPYDISSMSEEGSIHHDAEKNLAPGAMPELATAPSFPPSPFSTLPQPPLNSISNNNVNTSPRATMKPPQSPAGSLSSVGSPNGRSQQPLSQVPRFYDSEDDGPGSLVFVESQSTMGGVSQVPSPSHLPSPTQQQQRHFVSDVSDKIAKQLKVPNVSAKGAPPVLPYPQRIKMAMGEIGQEVNETTKKPPTAPKSSLAEKYKVAPIPLFRGGASQLNGPKSEPDLLSSPQASTEKMEFKKVPSPSADRNRPPLAHSSNKRTNIQEVINPTLPPPPPPTFSPQKDSPESTGFHIRCNSQTSISSLGSNAVDSVKGEKYSQQISYKMPPQGYPQMQPPNYYHAYRQQQMPPHQNLPNPKPGVGGFGGDVFNDVLGQDIATFLHGERIAAQTNPNPPHPNHMPPYWSPGYSAMPPPMWQGQQYQHHLPLLNNEPSPPPLTTVPNMELHRARLPSISDDDWAEELDKTKVKDDEEEDPPKKREQPSKNEWDYRMRHQHPQSLYSPYQNQQYHHYPDIPGYYNHLPMSGYYNPNQMPPSYYRQYRDDGKKSAHERSSLLDRTGNYGYPNYNEPRGDRMGNDKPYREDSERRRKKKKSSRRREKSRRMPADSSDEDESELRSSIRSRKSKSRRHRRKKRDNLDDTLSDTMSESIMTQSLADHSISKEIRGGVCTRLILSTKLLICNLPLSASAISLSIVLLGILWFKWAEEILSSCKEVTFHSSQCSLPDFPGCYFCDEFNHVYRLVTHFHTACSYIGGISAMLFFAKAMINRRSFIEEMSSPTTSSPAGLIFMTIALAFIGQGDIGEMLVILASLLHLVLVVWFIYMSLAYQTMPDPSWFANTIGIGLCAVKVWFYYPLLGHFLIAVTLMLTLLYFPISLIRVAMSEKMSATVSYLQMICPAICLHSLAIIMEPSFREERPDISHFQALQRSIYLPSLSCFFTLCIIGVVSSLHGIITRLRQISREEFSPAHAAYSFPLLMHALAVQSYRSGLDFFAGTAANPTLKSALHLYFVSLMVVGTFVSVICILMYIAFLPTWTVVVDPSIENEPPPPEETTMVEHVTYGESLIQFYTSPSILQANEAGVLLMAYNNEHNEFCHIRSRTILPALGFEPMMRMREFARERDALKSLTRHDVIHEGDEDNENTNSEVERSEVDV